MNSLSRNVIRVILGVVLLTMSTMAMGGLEQLSTNELEELLRQAQYEEDYPNLPNDYYEQEPDQVPSQFYEYDQDLPMLAQRFDSAIAGMSALPQQEPRTESLSHGTPVSHFGTTKANAPKNGGAVLPAYCDPPNPCPLGYTSKDGCLEDFENTSEFSRTYQAHQNCLCDSEHMFNCPMEQGPRSNAPGQGISEMFLDGVPPLSGKSLEANSINPFLGGEKLTIAAKKGFGF